MSSIDHDASVFGADLDAIANAHGHNLTSSEKTLGIKPVAPAPVTVENKKVAPTPEAPLPEK